ncbi:hypothetical protein VNI00_006774 [Paramarasmius palmivorus]|uniref:Uncharacterized protein n=1 Tax=Paramarasmius palmivorus TaxID=297713 RepID=A0AAW0D711_9AGAR
MSTPTPAAIRRSPRKATSIQHGPRRQICQKCIGPDRHYRVDCPHHSGNAKRAKRLQMAREQREQLAQAIQGGASGARHENVLEPAVQRSSSPTRPPVAGIFAFQTDLFPVTPAPSSSRDSINSPFPDGRHSLEIRPGAGPISVPEHVDFTFPSPECYTPLTAAPRVPRLDTDSSPNTESGIAPQANGHFRDAPENPQDLFTTQQTPIPTSETFDTTPRASPRTGSEYSASPNRRRRRPPLTLPGEQRVRPSKSNPIYGLVDGAKRGSERWEVARKVPQFSILPTWADCNKKFNEKMQAVLRLAEETADETGSWIYVAAQMPTGRHEYTHFASRRLRREAPGPVNDMNAIAHKMFGGLVSSCRKDVLQLELEVANQRTDLQKLADEKALLSQAKDHAEAVIQGLRSRLTNSEPLSVEELTELLNSTSGRASV